MIKKVTLVVFSRFSNEIPPLSSFRLITCVLTSELYTFLDKKEPQFNKVQDT